MDVVDLDTLFYFNITKLRFLIKKISDGYQYRVTTKGASELMMLAKETTGEYPVIVVKVVKKEKFRSKYPMGDAAYMHLCPNKSTGINVTNAGYCIDQPCEEFQTKLYPVFEDDTYVCYESEFVPPAWKMPLLQWEIYFPVLVGQTSKIEFVRVETNSDAYIQYVYLRDLDLRQKYVPNDITIGEQKYVSIGGQKKNYDVMCCCSVAVVT